MRGSIPIKRTVRILVGIVALVGGVTLVLLWWPQVVDLFKGFLGMALALTGMLILYWNTND